MKRLEENIPPIVVALDFILTPTLLVGIKQDERESVTLVIVDYNTLVVTPNVEATMEPE